MEDKQQSDVVGDSSKNENQGEEVVVVERKENHNKLQEGEERKVLAKAKRANKNLLKWQVIIEDWEWFCSEHPDKMQHHIRKGLPDCLRGTVWQMLSDSIVLKVDNRGLYHELLKRPQCSLDGEIVRDISRTFPKHICYRERHGTGQRSLFNVLKAYSEHHPLVGYCQGMGFITALLLVYTDEESAFWLLHRMVTEYGMEGLYKEGLPDLAMHFYVLERLMTIYVPNVLKHFKSQDVGPSMYASQWFLTLFACNFPFNIVLRIWDVFFAEGIITIYRVGLALLKRSEADLLLLSMEDIFEYFKTVPHGIQDEDVLIADSMQINLTTQKLKEITKEYTDSPAVRAAAQPRERGDFAFSKPSWLANSS